MNQLIRTSDQACLVSELKVADTFYSRLRGLIGVKKFEFGQGLLFPRCNNIHMWMMSISIDVVFLKVKQKSDPKEWLVMSVHSQIKPWKFFPVANLKADDVLELPSGMAQSISLKTGEAICIA